MIKALNTIKFKNISGRDSFLAKLPVFDMLMHFLWSAFIIIMAWGNTPDYSEAKIFYRHAANRKHPMAMDNLEAISNIEWFDIKNLFSLFPD